MGKIYLIRHGQASFLADDYDNLSNKGIIQSEALGGYFLRNEIHFDKIYVGKLKRHLQTFDAFSKAYHINGPELPKPVYLKELNEHQALDAFKLGYNDFIEQNEVAKKLYNEIQEDANMMKKNYVHIFGMFFREYVSGKYPLKHHAVQSWTDFREQTKKGIATILKDTEDGETVGVFTSGGTKSSIIGDSLGLRDEKITELNMAIRNTSFSQLFYSKNIINILSINEISHLTKELITFV